MGRRPCCAKEGLNRGAWSAREDKILMNYIKIHGEGKWRDLPQRAGLKRCGKSCRLRWMNYLRPDIKRGNISMEEEELIIRLHNLLGNRWSLIAGRLPGRTDNEIKNYWNTNVSKRVQGDKTQGSKHPDRREEKVCSRKSSMAQVEPHRVIRTKAIRCTKVIIPQFLENQIVAKKLVPQWDSASDSPPSALREDNSMDYLLDFDISDLIPDALDKAKAINEYNYDDNVEGGECGLKNVSFYPDLPVWADESRLDNLMGESRPENLCATDPFQPNEVLDLKNLTSFLNSEDEWVKIN